jgi:DNA-binding response OmpR family regulator
MARQVLLIEDEPNIAEAIRFILSRDGWVVSSHANGADAAEVVRALRPDVVVLDVMLPGRSGYDILTELRADPATAGLPVLMLSAKGQDRDRVRAAEVGADRFIAKPFSNAEVLDALRTLAPDTGGQAVAGAAVGRPVP